MNKTRNAGDKLKEQYFIDGHVIKWRRMGVDDQGEVNVFFSVVDEDGDIVVSFSIPREEIKRREDVVYAAKRALGKFPADESPAMSMTRAESPLPLEEES